MKKIGYKNLYLIITEEFCCGRSAFEIARAAIKGRVDIIQMREKNRSKDELLSLGKKLSRHCRDKDVKFIVNDDPMLAKEVDADGVHLGQEDMANHSINEAREMIGKTRIIGVSTHSLEQFKKANGSDVDYIAYGPVFPTRTKDYSVGIKDVPEILDMAAKPVFFIGGIDMSNIDEIVRLGVENIAVMRGILQAYDIAKAAEKFKKKITQRRKG